MKLINLFILLILTGCTINRYTLETICDNRKVVEIGGCGGYHYVSCAVRLDDGSRVYMTRPLIGDRYCKQEIKKTVEPFISW